MTRMKAYVSRSDRVLVDWSNREGRSRSERERVRRPLDWLSDDPRPELERLRDDPELELLEPPLLSPAFNSALIAL